MTASMGGRREAARASGETQASGRGRRGSRTKCVRRGAPGRADEPPAEREAAAPSCAAQADGVASGPVGELAREAGRRAGKTWPRGRWSIPCRIPGPHHAVEAAASRAVRRR